MGQELDTYMEYLAAEGFALEELSPDDRGTLRPCADPSAEFLLAEALARASLELGDTIGRGGTGTVRAALQGTLGRQVAVKLPRPDRDSATVRAELVREALVVGSLEHPNIVPLYALERGPEGAPLLVMKRIEGVRWTDVIRSPQEHEELFEGNEPLAFHLGVLARVCHAVEYAHARGVVHRDLKPDNVMIGTFGEVYVLDWGIAVGTERACVPGLPPAASVRGVVGTPAYLAPEMARGKAGLIGIASDVYQLGAVLHEVLTGVPRHGMGTVLEQLARAAHPEPFVYGPEIPPELGAVANHATREDPAARYPGVEAFRRAIQDAELHRASEQLRTDALRRRRALDRLFARELQGVEVDAPLVQRLATEAQFGLEAALRQWPGNAAAANELRELHGHLAERAIARAQPNVARVHLSALGAPPTELVEALDALDEDAARERDEVSALRRLSDDLELAVGAGVRARIGVALAVVVGLGCAVVHLGTELGLVALDYKPVALAAAAYGATAVAGGLLARRAPQNRRSRDQLRALLAPAWGLPLLWGLCAWQGVPIHVALGGGMLMVAVMLGALGATMDTRFTPVMLVWATTGAVCFAIPDKPFAVLSGGCAVGFLALARAFEQQGRAAKA